MTEILKARHASFRTDDGEVTYNTGPLPDDTPQEHLKLMRDAGMLAEGDEPTAQSVTGAADDVNAGPAPRPDLDAPGHVDPDPPAPDVPAQTTTEQPVSELYAGSETGVPPGAEGGSSSSGPSADLPDDAPDASQASVSELAQYIDSESLNAPQTVSLAEGDPDLAAKVLEAERTAQGGDARATVEKPLSRLAAKSSSGDTESGGDTPPAA